MNKKEKDIKKTLKDFWDWLWNSESWLSYIVFLALVFVVVKFLLIPGLGLAMNTSLPLAIVESSSMEHYSLKASDSPYYLICDKFTESQKFFDKEDYWINCGSWYLNNTNITKAEFQSFEFQNGFRKGDLMMIYGKKDIKVGDIIVFDGGRANPIIHRVISLDPIQTKGDHNPNQLSVEKNIPKDKIIGTAIFRIPYVGWIKLFFVELFQKLF